MTSTLKSKIYDKNGNELKPHYSSNGHYIKYVTQVERDGIRIVYPKNIKNNNESLIIGIENLGPGFSQVGSNAKQNHETIYKVTMPPLYTLNAESKNKDRRIQMNKIGNQYKLSSNALKMFTKQYERLLNKRPHTNINVNSVRPEQKFRSIQRQILARVQNGKITHLYLTDFDDPKNKLKSNNTTIKSLIDIEKQTFDSFRGELYKKLSENEQKKLQTETIGHYTQSIFNTPPPRNNQRRINQSPDTRRVKRNLYGMFK